MTRLGAKDMALENPTTKRSRIWSDQVLCKTGLHVSYTLQSVDGATVAHDRVAMRTRRGSLLHGAGVTVQAVGCQLEDRRYNQLRQGEWEASPMDRGDDDELSHYRTGRR